MSSPPPEEDKDDQWVPLDEGAPPSKDEAPGGTEEIMPSPPNDDGVEKTDEGKAECDASPRDNNEEVKRKSRVSFADSANASGMSLTIDDIEQPPITNNNNHNNDNNDNNNKDAPQDIEEEEPQLPQQPSKRRMGQRSTVLRKDVPVEFQLIIPEGVTSSQDDDIKSTVTASTHAKHEYSGGCCWKYFQKVVLNVKYPLKRQMMLSFGSIGALTIVLVMVVGIMASHFTGEAIKKESSGNVDAWVSGFMGSTSRLVAEALGPKIMPIDLVNWMEEVGRDRFAGYPTAEDDSQTPFFDTLSENNIYPFKVNPLPLDWDYRHTPNEMGNVNEETQVEHVQGRYPIYAGMPRLSTTGACFIMQKACDPRVTDPSSTVYYPNCTEANNDITTGGVQPSPTNEQVYRKGAELSPFLKAFYEYHQDLMSIGYYLPNSGSGASVFFPHYELDYTGTWVSVGCEWMRAPNPIDPSLGSIATEEEIARCNPEGTVLSSREYNPIERGWCRDQKLDPLRVHTAGPYINAFDGKTWLMSVGKSFFDHQTGKFVSCFVFDFSLDGIQRLLDEVGVDELGVFTLVRNDDAGTVVTSPYFDFDTASETTTIDDPVLQTGVDQAMFDEMKSLVDFSAEWNPEEAYKAFDPATFETEESIVAVTPIPPIPKAYDSTYKPEFYAVFTLSKTEGIAVINEVLNDKVDQQVWNTNQLVIIIGTVGLIIVLILILTTASWFVRPLKWMDRVGEKVLSNFGQVTTDDSGIDFNFEKNKTCTPNTELNSLTVEFEKMIARFSGEGTAKRMQMNDPEKYNFFEFSQEYAHLYKGRLDDKGFEFKYPELISSKSAANESLTHCNIVQNTRDNDLLSESSASETMKTTRQAIYKSPFFHWMAGLIVTPVLITTILISLVVLTEISRGLPTLTEPIEEEYVDIKNSFRSSATALLATQTSAVMSKAARDTYMLTRFANWLYFGGINISDSFLDIMEGTEDCKTSEDPMNCEYRKDLPCDCAWNDFFRRDGVETCNTYSPGESRALQMPYFASQSQDTDESGSRYSTSYPEVAYLPNQTAWWDNVEVLPQINSANTRYGSSYDRVQIFSALQAVIIPLYNYDKSNDKPLAAFIGFDAEGMMAGYQGCEYGFVGYSHWRSSEANGAAKLRPELCPLGKYGFDARCRGWYDTGKNDALSGNGTLHITAPYVFAGGTQITGQSTSSPVMQGDEYIGQTIVDFVPGSIFQSMANEGKKLGNGALITPQSDAIGHDVVAGPGFDLSGDGAAIEDLLNPDEAFDAIVDNMKAGNSGSGSFLYGQEKVFISYAPVFVKYVFPLDSYDVARGVKNETTLVYSLGLVETETGLTVAYQSIDEITSKTVRICIGVLSVLIILSALLMIVIALRVTSYMTKPIMELLSVLKEINRIRSSRDDNVKLKKHEGSCREVDNVYKTIEMLYTVVQYANVAFFSGDLPLAYKVLQNSLRLFTRLENTKAIAVACNNIGNTMLTVYRTMKANKEDEWNGMSKEMVIEKAMVCFAKSIKLGEEAYDKFYNEQGWSEECLVFMQYLANRYFNRAIFLLTTSADHKQPKDAVALGFRDLQIVTDMDVEIVDQCTEMGFRINRSERFDLMISRIRGLISLVQAGFSPEELYVEDQMTDFYNELMIAMKNPAHELFKDIGVAGRMQKFETELIKYYRVAKKDNIKGAKVAIRMLVEDEYLFSEAEVEAIKMLLLFQKTSSSDLRPLDTDGAIVKDLSAYFHHIENDYSKIRSSYVRSSLQRTNSGVSRTASKLFTKESFEAVEEEDETLKRKSVSLLHSSAGDFTMKTF